MSSSLRRMPDELLQRIFVQCRDLQDSDHCLLIKSDTWRVAQVCRKWRSVALSYPTLWNQLSLDLGRTQKPGHTILLGIFLSRSANVSLHVKLYSLSNWGSGFPAFMSSLAPSASRWGTLEMTLTAFNMSSFSCVKEHLTSVHSFRSNHIGKINHQAQINALSQMLLSAPLAIRSLHLYLDGDWVQKGGQNHRLLADSIRNILSPSLQHLRVESAGPETLETLSEFFDRSRCILQRLELILPNHPSIKLDNLLRAKAQLKGLLDLQVESNSPDYIHQLLRDTSYIAGNTVGPLFPELRALTVSHPTELNVDEDVVRRLQTERPDISLTIKKLDTPTL